MATPKQISANQRNAKKNTGSRSLKAKKAVLYNALRHGLSDGTQILPGENRAEYDRLEQQFYDQFTPESRVEEFLLGEMVACAWRLRRVAEVESGVLQHFQDKIDHPPPRVVGLAAVSGVASLPPAGENPGEQTLPAGEFESGGLVYAPSAPAEIPATLGQAFLQASTEIDAFAKISRHEATIRAGFYRAYHELLSRRAAHGAGARGISRRRRRARQRNPSPARETDR